MAGVTLCGRNNIILGLDMEDSSVVKCQIGGKSFSRRTEVLAYLRNTIRENGDFIHFSNKLILFKELYHILDDETWEVRHECLQLITELIPICGIDLDPCMEIILPRVIRNMGHQKVNVRRSTIQALHAYMKHTNNVQKVLQAIVFYGLESEEQGLGQECTVLSLPMLLTPEFDKENYLILVQSLARQLVVGEEDRKHAAFFSLQKVRQLVGLERFDAYLKNLHPKIVQEYENLVYNENNNVESGYEDRESFNEAAKEVVSVEEMEQEKLEFGIIPHSILKKLNDRENWNARCQGTEALRHVINSLNDVSPLIPHMSSFLLLLSRLVTDVNFKVATLTLDIYRILIDKVKYRIRPHLNSVVNVLSKQLADSKIVIRSGCIKALMQLMQCVSPMPMITILNGNLQHKNSRLREETINLITAALLTFPSYEFELLILCNTIAPMIMDPKRKIRQAVLECLAVLSQALGTARSSMLLEIVENIQRKHQATNVLTALQARLARRILPRVSADGLVEYSVLVPNSAGRRSISTSPLGGDIDWILAGSGSLSSGSASARANSDRGTSSGTARSSQSGSITSSPIMTRRIVSPGRTKSRLPWEEDNSSKYSQRGRRNRTFSDDSIYIKNKTSPDKDEEFISRSAFFENGISNQNVKAGTGSRQGLSKNTQKQVYLQKLRYHTEKNKDRVPLSAMGVSILPDKPVAPLDDEIHGRSLLQRSIQKPQQFGEASLSSTWPLQNPATTVQQSRRKVLEPIQSLPDGKDIRNFIEMPVPTRPTIMKSTSAHRRRKVPPIMLSSNKDTGENVAKDESDPYGSQRRDLQSGSSQDSYETIEDTLEQHSLENMESGSISSTDFEHCNRASNVYSPENDSGVSVHVYQSKNLKEISSPSFEEIPFNSKPVLVRSPSLSRIKAGSALSNNNSILNSSFSRPNSHADDEEINVVGRGMVLRDSAHSSTLRNGSALLPSHPHSPRIRENSVDMGINNHVLEPLPLLQGVAVTNTGSTNGVPQVLSLEDNDKQSEPDQFSSDYHSIEDGTSGDEDQYAMSMSQSTRDRLLFKKQEMMREAEKRRAETQHRLLEKQQSRQQQLLAEDSNSEDDLKSEDEDDDDEDDDENDAQSYLPPPTLKREPNRPSPHLNKSKYTKKMTLSPSKPIASTAPNHSPKSKQNLLDVGSSEGGDGRPFRNPEIALQDAIKHLNNSEWTAKCEGTDMISRLAFHHPEVLVPELHELTMILLREVKNLRSSVSRAAIACVGNLFNTLKKHMETDLDNVCRSLLHKSGESNKFIQEDVQRSLSIMIENLSPLRIGSALILGGASHKNALVRKLTAQLVSDTAEKLGPYKLLSGTKDITDKYLPAAAQFVMDCSPFTRYYGRKIFHLVIFHPNFDIMLQKYVPANTIRNIKTILDGIKTKGIGDKPSNSPPGRFRKADNMNKTM